MILRRNQIGLTNRSFCCGAENSDRFQPGQMFSELGLLREQVLTNYYHQWPR